MNDILDEEDSGKIQGIYMPREKYTSIVTQSPACNYAFVHVSARLSSRLRCVSTISNILCAYTKLHLDASPLREILLESSSCTECGRQLDKDNI